MRATLPPRHMALASHLLPEPIEVGIEGIVTGAKNVLFWGLLKQMREG